MPYLARRCMLGGRVERWGGGDGGALGLGLFQVGRSSGVHRLHLSTAMGAVPTCCSF